MRSIPFPSVRSPIAFALIASIGCSTAFDDSLSDNAGRAGQGGSAGQASGAAGRADGAGAAGAAGVAGKAGASGNAGAAGTSGNAGMAGVSGNAGSSGATAGSSGATAGSSGAAGANGGSGGSASGAAGAGTNAGGSSGAGGAGGCTQGQTRCVEDRRETCGSDGAWGSSVTCAVGCKANACEPCTGFTPTCTNATTARTCGNEGVAVSSSCGAQLCENGACVACTDGSPVKCVGPDRVSCEGGKPKVLATCGAGLCAPDGCLECTAGQKSCIGSNVATCQSGQFVASQECAPLACGAGACVPECSVGQRRCQGKALQECVSGLFTTIEQCGAGETCEASPGVCRACTENARRCTGNVSEICTNGKWSTDKVCAVGCVKGASANSCLSTLTAVAAGPGRTCVLAGTGSSSSVRPFCWGDSSEGALGIVGENLPPRFLSELPATQAIAMGRAHTCVVTSSTQVRCAGANNHGQLGRDTGGAPSATFSQVSGLSASGIIQGIFAGDDVTCVRRSTGAVDCWGQFSDGSTNVTPVRLTSSGVAVLAIGRGALGLQASSASADSLRSFGRNETGQLGIGASSSVNQTFPGAEIASVKGAKFLAAGGEHTPGSDTPIGHACAVDGGGSLSCWGLNDNNQTGTTGGSTNVTIDGALRKVAPSPALVFDNAGKIAAGRTHTCVRRVGSLDGEVWCFGENGDGRAGLPLDPTAAPRAITLSGPAGDVAVGDDHSCAIVFDAGGAAPRAVQCWGANGKGQLGDPSSTGGGTPSQVLLSTN